MFILFNKRFCRCFLGLYGKFVHDENVTKDSDIFELKLQENKFKQTNQ